MAKSTPRRPKKPVPINSSIALEDPPSDLQDAGTIHSTPFDQEPVPDPPQPARPAPQTKTPTFWENMKRIAKQDWGPRATIYLYRVEPLIDRTRSGDNKYIQTYAEPINEDRIMADFGSGRYKLILNVRKQGADVGDILDSVYMDILNMKYPPKIPIGEWVDDPRNKRWQWAKEASQPATPAPAAAPQIDPLAALDTFMDIQDRIEERIKPAAAPTVAAPAPVDPWAAAERILNMRSDNPMVELWKQQMAANQAAMEAERERQFKAAEAAKEREFKLQQDLLAAKQTNGNGKGIIEQLIEAAPLLEKLEPLKKFLGIGGLVRETADGAERVVRATKMGTYEFIADIAPKIINADIMNALAAKIMTGVANGPAPMPAMNGARPPQIQQHAAPDQFDQWLVIAGNPALMEHFTNGAEGGDLAEWVFWSRPDYLQRLQKFTHPQLPGLVGASAIIKAYQNTPDIWNHIRGHEQDFGRFIDQFCAWEPTKEEEDADVIPTTAEPADEWEQAESRPV